jgi:lysophospholipase L1-like esterase
LFWSVLPAVIPQAIMFRRNAPRFSPAAGEPRGAVGVGRPVRLLGIGDSVIAGVGAETAEQGIVARAAAALALRLPAAVAWEAIGKIGPRTERVHRQLIPSLSPAPYDFMVLSCGVNDAMALMTRRRWRGALVQVLDALTAHSPRAIIGVVGMPPMGQFPLLPQPMRALFGMRATSFDLLLRETLASYPRAVHLPIGFSTAPGHIAPDGFHPSVISHGLLGEAMGTALFARQQQLSPTTP